MSNSSDLGRIEELGRQLSELVLAPPDEAALRQLIELARQNSKYDLRFKL